MEFFERKNFFFSDSFWKNNSKIFSSSLIAKIIRSGLNPTDEKKLIQIYEKKNFFYLLNLPS